jgi:pullulanase
MDWNRKKEYKKVSDYYAGLIALRKAHTAFRMKTAEDVKKNLQFYEDLKLPFTKPGIGYVLNGAALGDSWDKAVVLINPERTAAKFGLPEGTFKAAVLNGEVNLDGFSGEYSGNIKVPALSVMVLFSK